MFKIGRTWAILDAWVGTLGAQLVLPKPNLAGAYPDTWLSLLESHACRCGTRVHACFKHVVQEDGYVIFIESTGI